MTTTNIAQTMPINIVQPPYSSFKGTKGKDEFSGIHEIKQVLKTTEDFIVWVDQEATKLAKHFKEKNDQYKSDIELKYLTFGTLKYRQLRWEMDSKIQKKRIRIVKPIFFQNSFDAQRSSVHGEEIFFYLQNNPVIKAFLSEFEVLRLELNHHRYLTHCYQKHLEILIQTIETGRQ